MISKIDNSKDDKVNSQDKKIKFINSLIPNGVI